MSVYFSAQKLPWLFMVMFISFFAVTLTYVLARFIHDKRSPRLTVNAEVVDKRVEVTRRRHKSSHSHSVRYRETRQYFVTFQTEGGDRLEMWLRLDGEEYDRLKKGLKGKLTFQETKYIGFETE